MKLGGIVEAFCLQAFGVGLAQVGGVESLLQCVRDAIGGVFGYYSVYAVFDLLRCGGVGGDYAGGAEYHGFGYRHGLGFGA